MEAIKLEYKSSPLGLSHGDDKNIHSAVAQRTRRIDCGEMENCALSIMHSTGLFVCETFHLVGDALKSAGWRVIRLLFPDRISSFASGNAFVRHLLQGALALLGRGHRRIGAARLNQDCSTSAVISVSNSRCLYAKQ